MMSLLRRMPAARVAAATLALCLGAAAQIFYEGQRLAVLAVSARWQASLALCLAGALALAVLLALMARGRAPDLARVAEPARRFLDRAPALGPALLVLIVVGWLTLVYGPWGRWVSLWLLRALAFWLAALAGAWTLDRPGRGLGGRLAASGLALGLAHRIAAFLPDVSTYPLSMGWSEASRYYYASLLFARSLYGEALPLSPLHPSRYMLQSIPFLIEGLPLWAHRLWQVLLWIGTTAATALALGRRLGLRRAAALAFSGWAFLYLLAGGVYYHLHLCALVVLVGFDGRRPARTWAAVLLASAWAGLSRVNWFPMPGFLAAALYLLESPPPAGRRAIVRWLAPPALWVALGGTAALAASAAYAVLSGNPPDAFASSFTSDLLWYRLLPNRTYAPGVILGVLLLGVALLAELAARLRTARARSPTAGLTVAGLGGLLGALFAGGLVVSVKIGGGGDLHNMDAFLLLLLVVAGHAYYGRGVLAAGGALRWSAGAALAAALGFTLMVGSPFPQRDHAAAQRAVEAVRQAVEEAAGRGETVLFLSERHLVTFGIVEGVRMVPEYEKVFLMEMAMARNPSYLGAFYGDLEAARFGLIVSEPLGTALQGRLHTFGEENDAWVERISVPLLRWYRPADRLEGVWIWLLEPVDAP